MKRKNERRDRSLIVFKILKYNVYEEVTIYNYIVMAVYTTTRGQQINQSDNRYRSYDVLEKKQVSVKGFDLNSKKCVWSLEDAELSENSYNAEYSTETDTLMAVERGDRTY